MLQVVQNAVEVSLDLWGSFGAGDADTQADNAALVVDAGSTQLLVSCADM